MMMQSANCKIAISMDGESNVVLDMVDTGIPKHVASHLKVGLDKDHALILLNSKDVQGDTCDHRYYIEQESKSIVVESVYSPTLKKGNSSMIKTLLDENHLQYRVTKFSTTDSSSCYFTAVYERVA